LKPFSLTVFDGAGAQLEKVPVKARQRVTIALPPGARPPMAIRLHVEGGGKTTSQDARVMNFRVFEHAPSLAGTPVLAGVAVAQ
jgi:hypothetical protein